MASCKRDTVGSGVAQSDVGRFGWIENLHLRRIAWVLIFRE